MDITMQITVDVDITREEIEHYIGKPIEWDNEEELVESVKDEIGSFFRNGGEDDLDRFDDDEDYQEYVVKETYRRAIDYLEYLYSEEYSKDYPEDDKQ